MALRISPLWWPVLAAASPLILPMLIKKNRRFKKNRVRAVLSNQERMKKTNGLDLPELDFVDLTALVEEKCTDGFKGDAAVSYLLRSNQGALLYDIGFGDDRPALTHNAAQLNFDFDKVDGLVISHLHPDHMGGMKAARAKMVAWPSRLGAPGAKPCFLPDTAAAQGFQPEIVKAPQLLPGGFATTGPLARSLFFLGFTEEQALVARIKNKGLAVFTGCGHPTIEVILDMVSRLSEDPIYCIAGGLHFPITQGRGNRLGLQFQMFIGTGRPPWQRLTDEDLSRTIQAINRAAPRKVWLSGHDTCDHALARLESELKAQAQVLKAGETYRL